MIKNSGLPIAAAAAFARGDIEDGLIASTPGGIEAQEAAGQKSFVASDTLPIKCNFCAREQLEEMGVEFGEPVGDLFVEVRLPEGWKKERTSHSMWSKLVDEKGRERATIFYKAAFYDQRAHIVLVARFSYRVEPVCGYDAPLHERREWHCIVTDCGQVVWASEDQVGTEPEIDYNDDAKRQAWLDWSNEKDGLGNLGKAWLDEHYPDWQNPLAYWD